MYIWIHDCRMRGIHIYMYDMYTYIYASYICIRMREIGCKRVSRCSVWQPISNGEFLLQVQIHFLIVGTWAKSRLNMRLLVITAPPLHHPPTHICINIYIYMYMFAYWHAHIFICIYVYLYIYVYVYIYRYVYLSAVTRLVSRQNTPPQDKEIYI